MATEPDKSDWDKLGAPWDRQSETPARRIRTKVTSLCRGPDGRLITVSTEHYRDPSADSPQQDPTDRSRTRGRSPADQHQNNAAKGRVQSREEEPSESHGGLDYEDIPFVDRNGEVLMKTRYLHPGRSPPSKHSGRSSTDS